MNVSNTFLFQGYLNQDLCQRFLKETKDNIEELNIIFDSDGGGVDFIKPIIDRIKTIPHTTAVIIKACSAAATIALHTDKRLIIPVGDFKLHLGRISLEYVEIKDGKIPKNHLEKHKNHKKTLFARLDELGFNDQTLIHTMEITGWMTGTPDEWVSRGLVE